MMHGTYVQGTVHWVHNQECWIGRELACLIIPWFSKSKHPSINKVLRLSFFFGVVHVSV